MVVLSGDGRTSFTQRLPALHLSPTPSQVASRR